MDLDERFAGEPVLLQQRVAHCSPSRHAWLQHQSSLVAGWINTDAAQGVKVGFTGMSAVAANDRVEVVKLLRQRILFAAMVGPQTAHLTPSAAAPAKPPDCCRSGGSAGRSGVAAAGGTAQVRRPDVCSCVAAHALAQRRVAGQHRGSVGVNERIDFQMWGMLFERCRQGEVNSTSPWWRSLTTRTRRTRSSGM